MLDLMLWMPAEELARRRGVPVSDIIGMAMAGQIESCRQGDRWYVERPLVWLFYPDPTDVTQAELKVFALALGRYLTAARRMVTIPLRRDDTDREDSLENLCDALQGPLPVPVPFRLDGRDFLVDSSLQLELATALVDFDARYDASVVAGLLADDTGSSNSTDSGTDVS
jgi:hypothetical protein